MNLTDIFNLLIDIREDIERQNEEFICSCCVTTIENLNTAINALAKTINPKDNETTQEA